MAWFTLFDQEEVLEDYIASDRREQAEKNAQIAAKKLYSNKVSVDVIAQSLGYSVKDIEEWLSLVPQV